MKTVKALAKNAVQAKGQALVALKKKMEEVEADATSDGPQNAVEAPRAFAARRVKAKRAKATLSRLQGRQSRPQAGVAQLQSQIDSGRFSKPMATRGSCRNASPILALG